MPVGEHKPYLLEGLVHTAFLLLTLEYDTGT